MFRKLIHIAVFSAFLLSACGGSPTNAPESTNGLPLLTDRWTITMSHTGGIIGVSRSVVINSTGSYTVHDDRANKNITGQLSEGELTRLIEAVHSSNYSPNSGPSGCADCFIYTIEIISNKQKFSTQVDDVTIEKSGLGNLVSALRNIIERELK